MVISSYHVKNVLRVYGEQLRQGKAVQKTGKRLPLSADRLDTSGGAKRLALIEKIASTIVDKILQQGLHHDMEKGVFKKLQEECGAPLTVSPKGATDFLFRVIDEKGESLHSLSIEDADFRTGKLKAITTDTLDKKMFQKSRSSNENP
jgi:hypothetical protein